MISKNTSLFLFIYFWAFLGLLIINKADGSSTNNIAKNIIVIEEIQGESNLTFLGENDPVTKFINEFNSIADAINQGDISDDSINADDEHDALIGIISNADGITGGLDQAEDIFNSISTAGVNKDDNNDLVALQIDNNNNPAESFLNLFNSIADGINDALNDTGIEDIISLLEIVSSVLGVVSMTGIPEVVAAKVIIDAITGIANFILENNNPEVIAAKDVADNGSESTVDSSETNAITLMFNSFTGNVTEMLTDAKNSLTGFTNNFFLDNNNPEEIFFEDVADNGSESTVESSEASPITPMFSSITGNVTEMFTNTKNSFTGFTNNLGFSNNFGF